LLFVLALGWEPSEIRPGWSPSDDAKLDEWRDFFLMELKKLFIGAKSAESQALRDAVENLDQGKHFVFEG
jgi:hypothetical protein